jgi:predicted amidohydrolase
LLFPECFLQGYLVESEHLSRYALDFTTTAFRKILDRLSPIRPTLVFGVIEQCGAAYFNTAVVVRHGALEGFYRKTHLVPGERLFQAGDAYPTFSLNGVTYGINICYDTNFPEAAKAGPNVLGKPVCGWCQPTSRAHGTEAGLATGRPAS